MADEKIVDPNEPLCKQELTPYQYKKTPWESESFREVNNSLLTIRGAWS